MPRKGYASVNALKQRKSMMDVLKAKERTENQRTNVSKMGKKKRKKERRKEEEREEILNALTILHIKL
jgi:hypothetical protein